MMRRHSILMMLAITWGAALVGCKSSDDCGQPDHDEYSCAPLPAGAVGCPGLDNDASYPEGCQVTTTACLAAYPGPTLCYCGKMPNASSASDGGADAGYTFVFSCPV